MNFVNFFVGHEQYSKESSFKTYHILCILSWPIRSCLFTNISLDPVVMGFSGSGWCSNRALCDTNLKFGTMIMTKQTFLDIGPSQIRPVNKMATIFKMATNDIYIQPNSASNCLKIMILVTKYVLS